MANTNSMPPSSSPTSPPLTFRSLLPHEPLPQNEEKGYIHLTGAFTPKKKTPANDNDNDNNIYEPDLTFWTRASLRHALLELLTVTNESNTSSKSAFPMFPAVQDVHIVDETPPFTKVRLVYASPQAAHYALVAWRRQGRALDNNTIASNEQTITPSPANLFADYIMRRRRSNNFETEDDDDDLYQFRNKELSVSQITATALPQKKLPHWNRSNPPKFRRFVPRPGEDAAEIQAQRKNTRIVFLTNLLFKHANGDTAFRDYFWNDPHCFVQAIRNVVQAYDTSGHNVEVFCTVKKMHTYCHVGMRNAQDAQALVEGLQDQQVVWTWTDAGGRAQTISSGRLFLDYAGITNRSAVQAQRRKKEESGTTEPKWGCTSTTAHVTVPGLVLVPDFCTPAEEAILLATITGPHAPWAPPQITPAGGTIKRQVQHYGYVFDYLTADVLRDRSVADAACPALPGVHKKGTLEADIQSAVQQGRGWDVFAGVVERTRRTEFASRTEPANENATIKTPPKLVFPHLNQLTVNQYKPGEGIGSHVDTPSAFGDGLISLSLNGGITMEFRKVAVASGGDEGSGEMVKKYVYLPPRSLLLMSGPARYEWEHMIVSRRTDTHNDVVIPRKLRVSLTMRTALALDGSVLPRVESSHYPPTWGTSGSSSGRATSSSNNATDGGDPASQLSSVLKTPACERDHVHAVYDAVATQWHHTRGRRGVLWAGATEFLSRLPQGSLVADVGCGDGKYFPAIWEAGSYVIGTDISRPLLQTAIEYGRGTPAAVPESRRVRETRQHLGRRPAVAVADCLNVPLRDSSCDAVICIAVLHHLSTVERRERCIAELVRIVKPGGMINIQAWAMEQAEDSRRKFVANDVFVPFNAQPKYLALAAEKAKREEQLTEEEGANVAGASSTASPNSESTAAQYSKVFANAEYDDRKGLVVFQRYCHLYRDGELGEIVSRVPGVQVLSEGFESGNHFVILQKEDDSAD